MTGRLRFYHQPTSWGVIAGEDGRLYMVRGEQLPGPPPREGERVTFEPVAASGGPRAENVQRVRVVLRPGLTP
jgi:cold shock CspA family protein